MMRGHSCPGVRAVDNAALVGLMALANDTTTLPEVRAVASAELRLYKAKNSAGTLRSAEDPAAVYFAFVAREIEQWEKDPTKVVVTALVPEQMEVTAAKGPMASFLTPRDRAAPNRRGWQRGACSGCVSRRSRRSGGACAPG